jgi:LuxR family maltose regulon positive regulatory protein
MSTHGPRAHLPAHVVRRGRLIQALAAPGARLVVVTGPAGSGKTVAVRDWASTTGRPTAWLPLDASHRDPEHLLAILIDVLEDLCPGVRAAIERDDPGDRAADRGVERAVEHLASCPLATLVLDDLHAVDNSPAAELLDRLVGVLPDTNLQVVICSRSDPPLRLHRFRLAGEVVELREADLRFDVAEAHAFFAAFPQVDLTPDQIERLALRTEGWAAGLQFAALSLAGRADVDALVDRFAGSERHVADFLLDEVLGRQPDDLRDFLLATAVLNRLSADLCAYVTGRPDAAALLHRIETENLFLVPLDDSREWYRYHPLFSQLLRREVRLARPQVERTANERAAAWFSTHGDPERAIDHWLDAGAYDAAFDLLTEHIGRTLRSGRYETLRGWLLRFPAAFVDTTPGRQLTFAIAFGRAGELETAHEVIERARAHRPAADPLAIHYDVAAAAIAAVRGYPDVAIELGTAAWNRRDDVDAASLPPDVAVGAHEFWGYLPVALARAHALVEDRAGVHRWATVLRREGPLLRSDLVGTLGAEAWVEARRGRLRVGAELADQALVLGAEVGRGARRTMIGARTALALVHRDRDELDAAVDVVAPHIDGARREGHIAITTLAEVVLARVECARGRADEAISRVLRVRRDGAARGLSPFLAGALDYAECLVRLVIGDVDRAADLLEDLAPGPARTLLEARAALATGRPEIVGPLLADLRADDEDRRRRFEAVALSARAAAEVGELSAARRLLAGVADVAQREGAVRTFLDEGFDILEVVGAGAGGAAWAGAGPGTAGAAAAVGLVEPLSERELSVLRYLPSRLSNREIGNELYVSLNTVKSHLKTIYRKLDVERRDEAVRRARQLGLL